MTEGHAECGGKDWLGQVLDLYERRLVGYAARLVRDDEAARDLAQDTFLELCRRPMELDHPGLRPWLYTVCRNRAIDRLRKERRMHLLDEPQTTPATQDSPAQAAERAETEGRLLLLLGQLPPRQQEVVWLRFRGGLSYREIADVTKHPVGTVGSLLHEALKRLRERLGEAHVASAAGDPS